MWKIKRGAFTQLLISQFLSVIECQTWILINAKCRELAIIVTLTEID